MRPLSLTQLTRLLRCPETDSFSIVQGYSVDSRLLKPGELFFALKGERVDGHHYLREAKERGAIAAIVSKHVQTEIEGFPLIRVEDPLHALQELAQEVFLEHRPRVVAVTGSVGKTSAKEFMKVLLATQYCVGASPGNSNSQIGLPLSILNHTTGDEELLVLEMSMTLPGHLRRLIQLFPPEVAVITQVTLAHACNFASVEEIATAKMEILEHPKTLLGVIPRDFPQFERMRGWGTCQKQSFSLSAIEAEYGSDGQWLEARLEKKKMALTSWQIPGKHNLHLLLAAIAVARYFHVAWENIEQAIPSLKLLDRRLQRISHQGILFIDDSYNNCELSIKAALELLPSPLRKGRKMAVLGEMRELGKFSNDCHRRVGEYSLHYVDKMYCVGTGCQPIYDLWREAGRPVELFENQAALVTHLREELRPDDVVLVKGSNIEKLGRIIEELKNSSFT